MIALLLIALLILITARALARMEYDPLGDHHTHR